MRSNSSSEHHQNNNLKVVMAFSNFLGKDNSLVIPKDLKQFLQAFLT